MVIQLFTGKPIMESRMSGNTIQPLVSIVIPAYNAAAFIGDALDSIFRQSYSHYEIIIVNDGSKDNTLQVIEAITALHSDKRIKTISKTNSGVSDTRNLGMGIAVGDYIALLDADDVWHPDNLAKKVAVLRDFPDIDFVYCQMNFVDEKLGNLRPAPPGKDDSILNDILMWNGEVIPGPSSNLVFKRHCLEHCKFSKQFSTIADQHFTVQLARKYKGKLIDEYLWNYRIVQGSMSKSLALQERDALLVYQWYAKNDLFSGISMRCKAFSKMYLILAGSWWKDGKNPLRACDFLFKSAFIYPPSILMIFSKIMNK